MEYIKVTVDPIPVLEVVSEYIASVQHLGPRTLEEYQYELQEFAQWCVVNDVMLHQVNNKTVHQFLAHIRLTHKPSRKDATCLSDVTLAGYVRVIKSFLNWCFEEDQFEGQIKVNTLKRIKKPSVEEPIIPTFTKEDIKSLLTACEREYSKQLQIRDQAIIALLVDTGIRASELITLKLSNVSFDPKDSYIKILGKRKKWGEVGIGTTSKTYLRKYVDTYRIPCIKKQIPGYDQQLSTHQKAHAISLVMQKEPLFLNRWGQPLTANGLNRIIKRVGEWAGITGVRCCVHDFRHTFAVNFIRQGGDIYTLSQLLRHNRIDTTEEYLASLRQTEARRHAKSVLDGLQDWAPLCMQGDETSIPLINQSIWQYLTDEELTSIEEIVLRAKLRRLDGLGGNR